MVHQLGRLLKIHHFTTVADRQTLRAANHTDVGIAAVTVEDAERTFVFKYTRIVQYV